MTSTSTPSHGTSASENLLAKSPGDVSNDAPGLLFELPFAKAVDSEPLTAQIEIPSTVVLEGD